jgi:hypothetical protein
MCSFNEFISPLKNNVENFMGIFYLNKKGIYKNTPNVPFSGQLDFPYNNKSIKLDEETHELYNYLESKKTPNANAYQLSISNSKRIPADKRLSKLIWNEIDKIFNSRYYEFENIRFQDRIHYYNNPRGKEIEPFKFKADVKHNGKHIGELTIHIEAFINEEREYYRSKQYLTILNIKLINHKYPEGLKKKKIIKSMYKVNNYQRPTNEDVNNIFMNSNDTDNSLIPSTVEFSNDYESTTDVNTTD